MCPRSKEIQAETEMLLTCRKTQRTHTTKAIGHTIKIKIIIQMMDMQIWFERAIVVEIKPL